MYQRIAAAGLLAALVSCSDPYVQGVDYDCSPARGLDCPAGQTCVDNWCHALCSDYRGCAANEVCGEAGYCVAFVQSLCSNPGECPGGSYCDGMSCQRLKVTGTSCAGASECQSGHCADGVCCDTPCGGSCEACVGSLTNVIDGTCAPCGGTATCDGTGVCRLGSENGVGCGAASQCASGFCVDGVCCESACEGVCWACSAVLTHAEPGVCAPVRPRMEDTDGSCPSGRGCDGEGACRVEQAWGLPQRFFEQAARPIGFQAALRGDTAIVATWGQTDGVRNNLWVAEYDFGVGWSEHRVVDNQDGDVGDKEVAASENGRAVIAWIQPDLDGETVWAAVSPTYNQWGQPVRLQAYDVPARRVATAIDGTGRSYVSWTRGSSPQYELWLSIFVPEQGTWSEPLAVSSSVSGPGHFRVGATPLGRFFVAWTDSEPEQQLWVRQLRPGEVVLDVAVALGPAGEADLAGLATASNETAIIVLNSDVPRSSLYAADTGWSVPFPIEEPPDPSSALDAVLSRDGDSAVVPLFNFVDDGQCWLANWVSGTGWLSPTEIEAPGFCWSAFPVAIPTGFFALFNNYDESFQEWQTWGVFLETSGGPLVPIRLDPQLGSHQPRAVVADVEGNLTIFMTDGIENLWWRRFE